MNFLNKFFRNEEQTEELTTPVEVQVTMVLEYDGLVIGNLSHAKGIWHFEYSEAFKKQDKVDVLIDFPDKNQKYKSEFLWPFFAHRIPGLGQPQVQEIIKAARINKHNQVDLLKKFGQKSISNPFVLSEAV
jgi:HipA-like protein